jgi:galactose-3-O-sulfotransferase
VSGSGGADGAQLREIESLARELAETSQAALERVREARAELPPQTRLVAFVHIPKTAGGTALEMFMAAYSRQAVNDAGNFILDPEASARKLAGRRAWVAWERRGGRVTAGHVPYGIYRQYLPQGTRYMTVLRDPVERVTSHYHQHIHRKRPGGNPRGTNPKKVLTASMEEAFDRGLPMISNLATRFLCGHPSPMGELPEGALEDAKANLREFAFVGVQERFAESMVLLQRLLGLELTPYVNRHVTVGRPKAEDLSEDDRQLILEHNRLDSDLYSFACGLFEEAVEAAGADFAADAERLEAMSEELNDEALGRARELLDRELPVGASMPKAELFAIARRTGVPAAALKFASKMGVQKHGQGPRRDGQKVWTRTG